MAVSALYTPVEENDGIHKGSREGDSFDFLLQEVAQPQNSPRNRVPRRKVVWIIHLLLLMTSCSILLLALKHERDGKYDCVKRQSFYSPALEAVGDWTDTHRLNGSFRFPSVWRGEPSPEVDAAWSRITDVGAFQISEDEMKRVDPTFANGAVKLSSKQGGGYMASLEVFHQLHCVNLVRQYTYKDYYQDKATSFEDPPDLLRIHVDHCLEILRQVVMCHSDLGILTYNWVSIRTAPWPNFNTQHKCRDFEAVLGWGLKHQARSMGEKWTHTAGVVVLPTPP